MFILFCFHKQALSFNKKKSHFPSGNGKYYSLLNYHLKVYHPLQMQYQIRNSEEFKYGSTGIIQLIL